MTGERAMVGAPLVDVRGLQVGFRQARSRRVDPVLRGVDLTVRAGECVALVGQSGSGKSVTARTLLGLAGERARVQATTLRLGGLDLRRLSPRQWRRVRGAQIGMILQDALVSLDPLRPVGREIDDALRLHTRLGPVDRATRVRQALQAAGMNDPELRAAQRSGELSGGLRQRALIAAAIVTNPPFLVADEPTSSLDAEVGRHVLNTLGLLRDGGTAILLISHDLSAVARIADRVAVLHDGVVVETGPTDHLLDRPRHPYTVSLLRAVPDGRPRGTRLSSPSPAGRTARRTPQKPRASETPGEDAAAPALEMEGVSKSFRTPAGRRLVVDRVSLRVPQGRTLGLVGPSGSGKTTLARLALGLTTPERGAVRLFGRPWAPLAESGRLPRRGLLGAVYQDALSSFDPRLRVGAILADALSGGRTRSPRRHVDRIGELLEQVGLPGDTAGRHPRDLSGGQRQRVAIARALAARPRLLICDEPVSSLDVLVQARVLDLFDELQETLGLAYLFISHDLGVIRHMSDEVVVLDGGRLVVGEGSRL